MLDSSSRDFFQKKNNKFQGINQDIDNITLYVLQSSKKNLVNIDSYISF